MARAPEVFSGVTLKVDRDARSYNAKTLSALGFYNTTGDIYEKEDSYEGIEKTFYTMASLRRTSPRSEKRNTGHPDALDCSLYQSGCPSAEPVEVDHIIMDYIHKRQPQELKRISGSDVEIRQRTGRQKECVVSFQSEHAVLAQFARQKFITLYQKIATELQVMTFNFTPSQIRGLERRFPELLITPDPSRASVTVMGDYISLQRLEKFLTNGPTSPSRDFDERKAPSASVNALASVSPSTPDYKKPEEETCPICMDTLTDTKTLPRCQHSFCKECLKRAFDIKPACPICGVLYGELKGTQPENGTMKVTYDRSNLQGYERYGTIVIEYYIPSGTQGEEHPNPGQRYEGASRTAYLPDSSEGQKVLALLRRAFDQRLTFTIGRSSTTGRNNVVTWNDIHHKTSRTGGPSGYGYPDREYLSRVQDELKVKGIF